jgi:hypothetical protein
VNIAFQVYKNHDLEEERREQSKEKRQAKLMVAAIGDTPNAQMTSADIKARKLSCFNARSWGTWQGISQSPYLWDPVRNAPKQESPMALEDGLSPLSEKSLASQDSGYIG